MKPEITYGPFKTDYLRQTVGSAFKDAFEKLIMEQILPLATVTTTRVSGELRSEYDDRRHQGPRSAVRNRFYMHVTFSDGQSHEFAAGQIDFDPTTGAFVPVGGAHVVTLKERAEVWRRFLTGKCLQKMKEGQAEPEGPGYGSQARRT